MHDEVTKTTAAFAENLRKAWDEWKDQPIQWVTVGLDPGMPGTDHAVTSTTCARCSHAFTSAKNAGPLAATSAGMLSETLENEIAAHQERCFVAGDWVHAAGGIHRDGTIVDVSKYDSGWRMFSVSIEGRCMAFGADALRRIPRPQQGDRVRAKQAEYVSANPHQVAIPHDDIPQAPAPVLYDGWTSQQCLEQWIEDGVRVDFGGHPKRAMTPGQVAEAKRAYLEASQHTWSAQLRAKLAASATEERNRVRVELQCDEDPTW